MVTGAILAGVLTMGTGANGASEVAVVPVAQIDDASVTLDRAAAGAIVADAKSCKVPMAAITLAANPGGPAAVRIRSGSYLSPAITLTDAPQRIAIPFPTPYLTGSGQIFVEGQGQGVAVALTPVWKADIGGKGTINIVWTPKNPC